MKVGSTRRRVVGAVLAFAACAAAGPAEERRAMIRAIEDDVRATRAYLGKSALDPRVMEAMAAVPRHEFVPPSERDRAYENRPLPIGGGQTISQPYVVALMTDLAEPEPGDVVLEVGTGSGYQAAVLATLVEHVYTIEIVRDLGERARETLARLGYANVTTKIGDGYHGWPEHAPFDAVVVTAAADEVPPALVDQLAPGGRVVIPLRDRHGEEMLAVVTRDEAGRTHRRDVIPVRFVPLTGDH